MTRRIKIANCVAIVWAVVFFSLAGCIKKIGAAGTIYPNFAELADNLVPQFGVPADGSLFHFRHTPVHLRGTTFPSITYDPSSDWTTYSDPSYGYITDLLGADPTGPVSRVSSLLITAQNDIDTVNANYVNSDGSPTGCTPISTWSNVLTPFFDSNANPIFFVIDDSNSYQCFAPTTDGVGIILFGRLAISNPSASCTDPFKYSIARGYSSTTANTLDVPDLGASQTFDSISKLKYDGCTKDLQIILAEYNPYSAGVEVTSRTEITGNTDARTFSLRGETKWVATSTEAASNSFAYTSVLGTGKVQMLPTDTTPSHFIIGFGVYNCPNATCAIQLKENFCLANSSTGFSYAYETDSTQCNAYTADYLGLTPLDDSAMPHQSFSTFASDFGL